MTARLIRGALHILSMLVGTQLGVDLRLQAADDQGFSPQLIAVEEFSVGRLPLQRKNIVVSICKRALESTSENYSDLRMQNAGQCPLFVLTQD